MLTHTYTHPHTHTHTPTQTHTHTHTHPHTPTLTPPDLLQTVPHAAYTMCHRLKINGVTFIELKCEEFLNMQFKKKLYMYFANCVKSL